MKIICVKTSVKELDLAKEISRVLIEERLVACVQISKVYSIYVYEGEFCEEKEFCLEIKSQAKHFKKIKSKIKALHSYDLPEILKIKVSASKKYEKYIGENTK